MGLLVDTDTWAHAGKGDSEHVSSSVVEYGGIQRTVRTYVHLREALSCECSLAMGPEGKQTPVVYSDLITSHQQP